MDQKSKWNWVQMLGPGLLYAGAAVGVSHIVQSTRAGAEFGFQLLWAVIIANLIKYPFFEYGPRYAAATGKSLLEGYKNLGSWGIWVFFLLTLSTMFTIQAAVTVVTAGIAQHIFGISLPPWGTSAILLAICIAILVGGKYSFLDKFIKWVIVLLALTTIVALIFSFGGNPNINPESLKSFDWSNIVHITFLIALVGWMPAPIDIAAWHSVWAVTREKELGKKLELKSSLFDFKVGYWGTTFLAVCFLSLGAMVMYGTGEQFSGKGGVFAKQVIDLYTRTIGSWSMPIIAAAAFTTMFSTTITCLDAFPRILSNTVRLLFHPSTDFETSKGNYLVWISVTAVGTVILLKFFITNMGMMVKVATILSFVTAPILALMNYLVIHRPEVAREYRPPAFLKNWSIIGIIVLFGFCGWFLFTKFF